jgi:hypothetical protein
VGGKADIASIVQYSIYMKSDAYKGDIGNG